jgi:hypothetical protein
MHRQRCSHSHLHPTDLKSAAVAQFPTLFAEFAEFAAVAAAAMASALVFSSQL